jgi:hypothetical protein
MRNIVGLPQAVGLVIVSFPTKFQFLQLSFVIAFPAEL